jgi:hypothetical protein
MNADTKVSTKQRGSLALAASALSGQTQDQGAPKTYQA